MVTVSGAMVNSYGLYLNLHAGKYNNRKPTKMNKFFNPMTDLKIY
jgi:hypothetical protein